MRYTKLGKSDIEVSVMAFGCWAIVGGFNWGPQNRKDSLAALQAAYDAGINFFDTAEAYGNGASEEMIGEALGHVRDKIVIASKVLPEHYQPDLLVEACERSLKNLKTDWIDLYQLHWPNPQIPVEETLDVLEKLKEAGKIREYGVSNFGVQDMQTFLRSGYAVRSNQLAYNLLFRAIEYEILPLCIQNEIAVLCYSPLMQGLLTGKFRTAAEVPDDRARTRHFSSQRSQTRHGEPGCEEETFAAVEKIRAIAEELQLRMANISLAWLMAQPGVTSVIVGGRNPQQVQRNVEAVSLQLSQEIIERLSRATEPLKEKLGDNADMWQGGKDTRIH